MDPTTSARLERLFSGDNAERNLAFHQIIAATDEPVGWAYQVWDRAVAGLTDRDNQVRAVSAQLLCNLAKSDPDQRILLAFDALLNVTRDARFVTARHCLQNIWKVGLAGPEQLAVLMAGLRRRYTESVTEKNGSLVRFDIIVDLAHLAAGLSDDSISQVAADWIEEEPDPNYRRKSRAALRKSTRANR